MRSLSVLHVGLSGRDGGAERQTAALVAGLARKGHKVLALVRRGSPLERRSLASGAPIFPLSRRFPCGPGGWLSRWSRRKARTLAAAGEWDAIHYADPGSFGSAAGILNGAIAGRPGSPPRVLITYRGLKDGASRGVPPALRRHAGSGGAVHVASEGIWSALVREGFNEDLLTVIHPGTEIPAPADPAERAATRKGLGLDPDHEVMGVTAVLDGNRGVGELIEAAGILFGERPRARLVIVGDGPRRGALEEKARRADGGGRIIFTGWREETARIIRALDIYVFPGRGQEVFPLSLVEAMANGTPVVACDQAGIREIIENGKQGLLVPGTGAGALARTMGRALDEPERSRRMGQAGAVRVQRFNVRAMVEATERLYYRLTRSGGAT